MTGRHVSDVWRVQYMGGWKQASCRNCLQAISQKNIAYMSGDRIVDVDALDLRGGAERAENDLVFGILTSTGYLFIIIVLMVGIVLGDTPTLTVSLC